MSSFGSSSPFGGSTPSPFGGMSTASANPFASSASSSPFGTTQSNSIFGAKPFGSPTFGAPSGNSLFGGTATGVFGVTQPSPLGSSTPAFGASSTPAFGSTPSFGTGASIFGQKPTTTFGGFGSTSTPPANPFGSTQFGQTQPSFGAPSFGSGTFGSSAPAFGSSPFGTTTSVFGVSSTPAFGVSSTPAFGVSSTPAFGISSTPAFGASSTPAFGVASTPFGISSTPAFGVSSTPAFGAASSTPIFGATSMPSFGATSTPAFGASSVPAFGASSTPAFGTTSSSLFGSTTSLFGSAATTSGFGTSGFGSGVSPFGAASAPSFGSSPSFGSTTFGSSPFGGQRPGSRGTSYSVTNDAEAGISGQAGKLMSISAMPAYKNKSHEELRWEDYQTGDKGGPSTVVQPAATGLFGQSAPTTTNPFAASTSGGLFGSKPLGSFGMSSGASGTSPFGSLSTGSSFGQTTTPGFGFSSPFGAASAPSIATGFGSSSSTFGSSIFGSTPAFSSPAPSMFSGGTSVFGSSPFTPSQTTGGLFSTPTTPAMGPLFGISSAFQAPKPGSSFGGFQTTPQQTTGSFTFPSLSQTQPAVGGFGMSPLQGTNVTTFAQQQLPVSVSSPFGTLPALPQMSIGRGAGAGPSVQYGISNLPVSEKPTVVRSTSLLTPRHITQRSRIRLQGRRYHPSKDSPKVSFFSEGEETSHIPKLDALFVPRENPRALFIQQKADQSPGSPARARMKLKSVIDMPEKQGDASVEEINQEFENTERPLFPGSTSSAGKPDHTPAETQTSKGPIKQNTEQHNHKGNGYVSITGHRAEKAAVAYEHGADIEALMPKLRDPEYYIQPRVQELAAKERAEPGYCRRVKDFVVGRHAYGFIKFLGETDVRGLDLESIIQFNKCEVLVYMDENRKPAPGVGLNKPAEITLFNVKCIDKKTGQHLSEGPEVDKFERRLKKKTEEQGAEFVSYDTAKGEWNFCVKHFSKYSLEGEQG